MTTTFLVVDTETLDMAPPAALIELGWHSLTVDDHDPSRTRHVFGELSGEELFGIPDGQVMTSANRAIHHIDPASLSGLEPFDFHDWADRHDADYVVAHNAEFEQQWLRYEEPWICTYKIALRLWPHAPSHSNTALKYELGIPDSPDHHPAHRARPDAIVTSLILSRILHEASERGLTVADLVAWSAEPRLLPTCPIGKFRGRPWADVEWGFLDWMLRQADMEADLKWNARRELDRRRTAHLAGD